MVGGLRKIYGILGGGVYEKFCDLTGGSMKNKRQYLKGATKEKKIFEKKRKIFTMHAGSPKKKDI